MKKNLVALILVGFLAVLIASTTALAAAPTVTSVSPNWGNQFVILTVSINGTNFESGGGSPTSLATGSFGIGITLSSYTVTSTNLITATIIIAADAALGPRNVTVYDNEASGGAVTLTGGFTVGTAAPPGPVKCVKLGADIKWTGTITGTTGGTPFNCKSTTDATPNDYCLFKTGEGVGEEIGANQCGEGATPAVYQCSSTTTSQPWQDMGAYWEQKASCLTNTWGLIVLLNGIGVATNWIFVILMIVVGLLVIWGAFDIVTAAGSPEKVGSGRNKILYALIGLAVALLARALPSIVSALLGV